MTAKILIIDDTEALVIFLDRLLTRYEFEVETAIDGPTGIKKAKAWKPDLILLDFSMPDMSGPAVCKILRDDPELAGTPIIFVTAMEKIEHKRQAFDAGADDYITKPFQKEDLLLRIDANLRRYQRTPMLDSGVPTKIISVFTLRGGAGSTSLAVNLGISLIKLWGIKVPLIDLAMPVGQCDVVLNLKPRYNIGHLAMDEPSAVELQVIEDFLIEHKSGLKLLGGFVTPHEVELLTEGHVQRLLDFLRGTYPYIVIDCSHDFQIPTVKALDYASTILMPITPDIASVRVAASALRTFRELDYNPDKIQVIVNWVFPQGGLSSRQIERALNHPVTQTIQYHGAAWVEAINLGEPVIETQKKTTTALMLEDLAWDMSRDVELDEVPANPSESYLRTSRRRQK